MSSLFQINFAVRNFRPFIIGAVNELNTFIFEVSQNVIAQNMVAFGTILVSIYNVL